MTSSIWWIRILARLSFGMVLFCVVIMFYLDGQHRNSPLKVVPSEGKTIAHDIRGRGTVYLTRDEYVLYKWLTWMAGAGVAVFALTFLADRWNKTKKPS